MAAFRSARRLVRRGAQVTWTLLWPFLLTLAVALLATALISHFFGDYDQLRAWLKANYGYFLAWRLLVYSTITVAWLRVKRRVIERAGIQDRHGQLRRCEVMAVLIVCLFEARHAGLL